MPEEVNSLHKAYKLTPLFLLLSPTRCLFLSLRISSAQTLSFLALYTYSLHPFLHLFICLSVYFPFCLQTPC